MQKHVDALLEGITCKTCTLDGWDNLQKVHWLAKCIITEQGPLFRTALDAAGVDAMGSVWVLEQLESFHVEESGPDVVAAMVLDSPNVNRKALRDLEAKYPTVACMYCVCHIISLFFKDVFCKLPALKELWRLVKQTVNKFRNVKWLREKLEDVQTTNDEVKKLPQFANGPKKYLPCGKTRMASKYMASVRALEVNQATNVTMAYLAKYEENIEAGRVDDSDDDYVRRDRRGLTEILAESKSDLVANKAALALLEVVKDVLAPAYALLRLADSDRLMAGKLWRKCGDVRDKLEKAEESHTEFEGAQSCLLQIQPKS